jgi:RNA polymerase sigma factor (sigma-70 family)
MSIKKPIYEASPAGYREAYRLLRALRTLSIDEGERESLTDSITDVNLAINWLTTGRRPGSKRGIERRYRKVLWDPKWIEAYHSKNAGYTIERDTTIQGLSKEDRLRIDEAMHDLTEQQRECFIMHYVDLMSFDEIAMELHIGKSSVQTQIERAREKIEYGKVFNNFLF